MPQLRKRTGTGRGAVKKAIDITTEDTKTGSTVNSSGAPLNLVSECGTIRVYFCALLWEWQDTTSRKIELEHFQI